MTDPLMSVAIPAYNHAAYIEACLASVCAQTYPHLELVLIDDGSSDDTLERARRFLAEHPDRFRRVVLQRQENQGVSAASNACIQACQAEWVHLLGSDDLLHPEKITRVQQAIERWRCPELALVHTDVDFIDQRGEKIVRAKLERQGRPTAGPDFTAYRWLFFGEHAIWNPSVTLRRDAWLAVGGFDKALALEDLDCWLRLSARYAIARVPEVLASYRKHPGNSLRQRNKMLHAQLLTYAKFLTEHGESMTGLDRELRRHYRRNLRRIYRRSRKPGIARLAWLAFAALRSFAHTPQARDYLDCADILKR